MLVVDPRTGREGPEGGVEHQLYFFLTLVIDEGVWVPSYPVRFTHCTGGLMGQRAGLNGCGKSRPHQDSIPDHPTYSECLYQLHYTYPHR
jgi:hypothetical protein